MKDANTEIIELLQEMRDLLRPISACFEEQYAKIQHQHIEERGKELEALLTTPARRNIFPLLFEPPGLSQAQIAKMIGKTQPTVSRFISVLLDRDLIEQTVDDTGATIYIDKHNLRKLVEAASDHEA